MKRTQALADSGLYARIVADVREGAYLTASELAELTGVKERQVHHWVAGSHRPQGDSKERLLELHYIVEQLNEVYTPEGVEIWLRGRNRDLDGRKPIDLLRSAEFETVLYAIERLKSGAM